MRGSVVTILIALFIFVSYSTLPYAQEVRHTDPSKSEGSQCSDCGLKTLYPSSLLRLNSTFQYIFDLKNPDAEEIRIQRECLEALAKGDQSRFRSPRITEGYNLVVCAAAVGDVAVRTVEGLGEIAIQVLWEKQVIEPIQLLSLATQKETYSSLGAGFKGAIQGYKDFIKNFDARKSFLNLMTSSKDLVAQAEKWVNEEVKGYPNHFRCRSPEAQTVETCQLLFNAITLMLSGFSRGAEITKPLTTLLEKIGSNSKAGGVLSRLISAFQISDKIQRGDQIILILQELEKNPELANALLAHLKGVKDVKALTETLEQIRSIAVSTKTSPEEVLSLLSRNVRSTLTANVLDAQMGKQLFKELALSREEPISFFINKNPKQKISIARRGDDIFIEELSAQGTNYKKLSVEPTTLLPSTKSADDTLATLESFVDGLSKSDKPGNYILNIDINGFKRVNGALRTESFPGLHATGDMILNRISEILKQKSSQLDIVVRNGGDEFFLIANRTDDKAVQEAAKIISDAVANDPLIKKYTAEQMAKQEELLQKLSKAKSFDELPREVRISRTENFQASKEEKLKELRDDFYGLQKDCPSISVGIAALSAGLAAEAAQKKISIGKGASKSLSSLQHALNETDRIMTREKDASKVANGVLARGKSGTHDFSKFCQAWVAPSIPAVVHFKRSLPAGS